MARKINKVTASTQAHLDIEDIIEDLVLLKTGWVSMVLSSTAVNFDLLSEAEQDATIYAFGALLNSLSFPLQILVRSKKADITSYFHQLEEAERNQPNPDLKIQIQKYKDFIGLTVQRKTVLDKRFYLAINFSPLEVGMKGFGKKVTKAKDKKEILGRAKATLMPKKDHLVKQMSRLGLTAKQLNTQELIELYYDIYNPAPTGTQRVILDTQSYTTPIVKPALEVPTPPPPGFTGEVVQPKVAYRPPQTKPAPTDTEPNAHVPQKDALKNLQSVASKAAEFLGKPATKPNLGLAGQQNAQQGINRPVIPGIDTGKGGK